MRASGPFLLFVVFAVTSASNAQRIYLPSPNELVFKNGISSIETWNTDRITKKRYLHTKVAIDAATAYVAEHCYYDFFTKPAHSFKEEKWSNDSTTFTYTHNEYDSLNHERVVEKKTEYYNSDQQLIKKVVEGNSGGIHTYFTMIIDPDHAGYQNNELVKIRPPADTFQYIVNKQDENTHHYYIKERDVAKNGPWIITEESITGYKNGEFYSYENYRFGKLLNKYSVDTQLERNSDTIPDLEFEHHFPPHEHPTPSDTTYSLDGTFTSKKKIEKSRSSANQFMRIRLFMDEGHDMQIEEYVYDPRGLLIRQDISYEEYTIEYIYK